MPYPKDILTSRAIVNHGSSALIPPEGLVNNVVPGIENSVVSIVASPKMGASFVEYIITVHPGGGTSKKFGAIEGIECFLYVVSGRGKAKVSDMDVELKQGQYIFSPDGVGLEFNNDSDEDLKIVLYKQRYIPLEGHSAHIVVNNVNDLEYIHYDDMAELLFTSLLPTDDLGFDMNFHILNFLPGGCHPFIETHVQEHGAYILTGEGAYYLDNQWMPIKKGDFVWFGPYTTQGAYAIGRENFSYVYSKDCNRDPEI